MITHVQVCVCGVDVRNDSSRLWAFDDEFQILPTITIDNWETVTVKDVAKKALDKIKAADVGNDYAKQQVVEHFSATKAGDCMLVFPLQRHPPFKRSKSIRGSNKIKVSSYTSNSPNAGFIYIASATSSLGNIR